jgi:Protein of unknown function (DUF3467)
MASKSADKPVEEGTMDMPLEAESKGAAPAMQMQQPQPKVDDSSASARYANFCRVTGTPEEVIIDTALNSQPMGVPVEPIHIDQRLVINYFTAKRLLGALHLTVQRHEQAFGVLETDINKRVKRA